MKKYLFCSLFLIAILGCGRDLDILQNVPQQPGVATLLFPDNNENCTEGTVISESESEITFVWEASERTDRYELYLTNLFTSETVQYPSSVPELPIVLPRSTAYSWYVISISDRAVETQKSETWSFYNAGPGIIHFIPFPAEDIAPLNGAEIPSASSANLSWSVTDLDNDIQGYDVYFGASASPPLLQSDVEATQLPVPIAPGGTYFWQIKTKDAQGNASLSEVFTFKVAL